MNLSFPKKILQGIIFNKLIPELKNPSPFLGEIPKDYEISQFSEILLCGTGRGVAPLQNYLNLAGLQTQTTLLKNKITL